MLVGFGILQHLFAGERGAGGALASGVSDHSGEIADEKHHLVAKILELPQLIDQHGVSQMEVGCCGVKTGLYAQRLATLKLLHQSIFHKYLIGTSPDDFHRLSD